MVHLAYTSSQLGAMMRPIRTEGLAFLAEVRQPFIVADARITYAHCTLSNALCRSKHATEKFLKLFYFGWRSRV
jgi:hypothetical protein